MSTWNRWIATTWFTAAVLALPVVVCTDARAQSPAVDPAAVQRLKQMFEFMDGLQQFSVQTRNVVEDLHVSGHRIDRDMSATVTVKRPNKLRAVRGGGLAEQRFFYDGKTLMLYNPREKVYATEAAPADGREDDRLCARDRRRGAAGCRSALPQRLSADDAGREAGRRRRQGR